MAKTPVRTCVACRTSDAKGGFIRVVKSSLGEISVDPTGKMPGRGAYVCRRVECITTAFKRKAFDRALRTAVPAEMMDKLVDAVQGNIDAKTVDNREELR